MSNIDNSPVAPCERVPSKPRQDVATLLTILREAAEDARHEDPCVLMTGFFEHMPIPAWVKALQPDGTLTMVHVNRAYTAKTGITALDYIAMPDSALWESAEAGAFEDEDLDCVIQRRTLPVEGLIAHPNKPNVMIQFAGWKWPIMVAGDVVAVCGMAQIEEVAFDGA